VEGKVMAEKEDSNLANITPEEIDEIEPVQKQKRYDRVIIEMLAHVNN
jgi:hypothetical protein